MPTPPFPPSFQDPDVKTSWTRYFYLDPGRSLRAVTVTVVDSNDAPISGTDLILSEPVFAQTDAATNKWGVTFSVFGGTNKSDYLIRFRGWFDNRLDSEAPSLDSTVQMHVEHT